VTRLRADIPAARFFQIRSEEIVRDIIRRAARYVRQSAAPWIVHTRSRARSSGVKALRPRFAKELPRGGRQAGIRAS
jgi:hypothetical protein